MRVHGASVHDEKHRTENSALHRGTDHTGERLRAYGCTVPMGLCQA